MRCQQRGNALFLILLAVALFGALSYAITQSDRSSGGINRERRDMAISEAIQFVGQLQAATQRMALVNGCQHDQFSFADSQETAFRVDGTAYDYTNPNAPLDRSCHYFDPAGGGLAGYKLAREITIDPASMDPNLSHPQATLLISGRALGHGTDVGTAGSDLMLRMGRLTKEACIAVNNRLGVTNPGGLPPADRLAACGIFTGTFSACTNPIGNEVIELQGKDTFCLESALTAGASSGIEYFLIHVLLGR